jgi:hypothetical protein
MSALPYQPARRRATAPSKERASDRPGNGTRLPSMAAVRWCTAALLCSTECRADSRVQVHGTTLRDGSSRTASATACA